MREHPVLKISPPGQHVELDGDALFLGRDCHLAAFIPALTNKVVSNRHCAIRREGEDRWMLEDLGSTNGTWMRGTRLFGKVLLHTGDMFTLGKQGPVCECTRGFGGTGPEATVPEGGLDVIAGAPTLLDDRDLPTIVAGRDGTLERPYKARRRRSAHCAAREGQLPHPPLPAGLTRDVVGPGKHRAPP